MSVVVTHPVYAVAIREEFLSGKVLSVGSISSTGDEATVDGPFGDVYARGPLALIMNSFCEKYNVSYRIITPPDNVYGVPIGENKFNGVVGMVQNLEVDLGGALFSMITDRQKVVDFSDSIGVEEYSIMMKTPKTVKAKNVLTPFSLLVWISILVSSVFMSFIMYVFINIAERQVISDKPDQFSLLQISWFVYGALVKQGSTLAPATDISRILFGSWWLFITIVTAFYTAQLTAVLASTSRTLPVNNLQELQSDNKATWMAMGGELLRLLSEPGQSMRISSIILKQRKVLL